LLIEWKLGESYFAEKLLDFELASNNGGWQWAASTGADAQPYFRIFNPALQSERFDADGAFIREWIPELKDLPAKYIHAPATASSFDLSAAGVSLGENYPRPIVDHATQKERAIALLASAAKREHKSA
jgi:deoxyribodipyrimidine photo-lyase